VAVSPQALEVLLKIYIGQNIRNEGILQSELDGQEQIKELLSRGLIRENHRYLNQFLTTDEGSELGKKLVIYIPVMNKIQNHPMLFIS